MKVVLHEMATYAHAQQLAQALASRGHEIAYVYCSSFQTPSRSSMSFAPRDKVAVIPLELNSEFVKRNFAKRFVQERAYGAKVASIVERLRPDLVISGNTPIEIQAAVQRMCRRSSTPFLLWLQDIYSIAIRSALAKAPLIGPLVAARYGFLERSVARRSDAIVAISDDFRDLAASWGADPHRIAVIENWGILPTDPAPVKENDWAARYGLLGKRVLLYAGALGFKHNPQLFLDLATEFRNDADVRIVVISEGYGAEWLSVRQRKFPGLVLLPFQAAADFDKALATADLLLTVLEAEAAKYSVPSKIHSYMAAGKPILAAIRAENLAARTILAAGAGITVDPETPSELRRLARLLMDDEHRRTGFGIAALAYARANFKIDGIASRFEEIFRRFARHRSDGGAAPIGSAERAAPLH